jgi:alanine dehydrogenase
MNIGIAKENRPEEKRVVIRPKELKKIALNHNVFVEQGAGLGVEIKDSEYTDIGARITDAEQVYSCPLVVRLKEPNKADLAMMRPGSLIFSMMHLGGNPELKGLLEKYKLIGVPMDKVKNAVGERKVESLHQTGYLGMQKGFELWGKDSSECVVKIMGSGNVAYGAIQCASRKFAKIEILNRKNFKNMSEYIPGTDILVNAINWPHELRGKKLIITKEMLKLFKKGAVICDLISNPEGQSPIETMHPTSLADISYEMEGVIHTSCWGWPGLDPVNITKRYSLQIAPIVLKIADRGLGKLPKYIQEVIYPPMPKKIKARIKK